MLSILMEKQAAKFDKRLSWSWSLWVVLGSCSSLCETRASLAESP